MHHSVASTTREYSLVNHKRMYVAERGENGTENLYTARRLSSTGHRVKRTAARNSAAAWQIRAKTAAFLKEHRPALYASLLLSERLYPHLREIDEATAHRLAVIADRDQAEEIINELVYE